MPQTMDLIHIEDRPIFFPEAGLSHQVLAYTDKLMLVRHLMEKAGPARAIAMPTNNLFTSSAGTSVSPVAAARSTPARETASSFPAASSMRLPPSSLLRSSIFSLPTANNRLDPSIRRNKLDDGVARPHAVAKRSRRLGSDLPELPEEVSDVIADFLPCACLRPKVVKPPNTKKRNPAL